MAKGKFMVKGVSGGKKVHKKGHKKGRKGGHKRSKK